MSALQQYVSLADLCCITLYLSSWSTAPFSGEHFLIIRCMVHTASSVYSVSRGLMSIRMIRALLAVGSGSGPSGAQSLPRSGSCPTVCQLELHWMVGRLDPCECLCYFYLKVALPLRTGVRAWTKATVEVVGKLSSKYVHFVPRQETYVLAHRWAQNHTELDPIWSYANSNYLCVI